MITQHNTVKRGRRVVRALAAWVLSAAVSFAPSTARAQGGEDHGDEKPTRGPNVWAARRAVALDSVPLENHREVVGRHGFDVRGREPVIASQCRDGF